MIRAHVAAVKALLAGQGLTVHEGGAPDDATVPYVVLWTDSGTRTRTKMCPTSDQADLFVTAVSVGSTEEQTGWVAEKVFAALLDQAPAVAGRSIAPMTHEASDPLRRDPDVVQPGGAIVFEQVDVFRLISRPS